MNREEALVSAVRGLMNRLPGYEEDAYEQEANDAARARAEEALALPSLSDRVRGLEAALTDTIRVIKMVKGLPDFAATPGKSTRRGTKERRKESLRENLDLYARSAENILGREVPR